MFIIGVVLLLSLPLLASWFRFIARQPPGLPQELTRASHGAGMVAFALLAAFGVFGTRTGGDLFRATVSNLDGPARLIPAALWLGVMILGVNWLVIGAGGTRSPVVDARLRSRAVAKVGLALFLWFAGRNYWLSVSGFGPVSRDLAWLAISGVAIWCGITGLTKIWLLQRGVKRGNRAPPPHPAPRGRAGDAPEAEAYQAMRRQGSRLSLDDRDF